MARVIAFFFFVFLSFASAATNFQNDSYDIFLDSSNGEVYLQAKQRFVLIASEINVPLYVTDGPNLVLMPDGNGNYSIQLVDTIPTGLVSVSDLSMLTGDFNGDGQQDLLLAPNINDSSTTVGAAVIVMGSGDLAPTQVFSYTQIQGISLADAIIRVEDTDADGRDELIVESESGEYQIANFTSNGFETDRSLKAGTLTGTTATEFDVTYGGAASYMVPLQLPTGAAGLSPSIEFNYNSQYGNGLMGLGWQLSDGLARIEECYRRNSNERILCLNGDELRSQGNGYYRTEIDSGILVEPIGTTQFKLHFENGDTKTLNRFLTSPNVFLETQHSQRGGASYSINWSVNTSNREPLVSSISYQGNEVRFNYESRSDGRKGYWMGSPRNRTQRLQSVVARVDGQLYRQYDVFYEYDSVSGLSKVKNIQECAGSGACLKPLSFDWTDSGAVGLSSERFVSIGATGAWNRNNDGVPDLGEFTGGDHYSYLADFDGDGRDDGVYYREILQNRDKKRYQAVFSVLFADGINVEVASFTIHKSYTPASNVRNGLTFYGYEGSIQDLNNDGRSEIIYKNQYGTIQILSFNRDKQFSVITSSLPKLGKFADFNGDLLPDLITIVDSQSRLYINNGSFSFASPVDIDASSSTYIDLNSDGLSDIYYGQISYGDGRFSNKYDTPPRYTFGPLIDLNYDGLPDTFYCRNSSCQANINNGDGSFSPTSIYTLNDLESSNSYVDDINGDGVPDLIRKSGKYEYVRYGQAKRSYIKTFSDSYGNQHEVEYSKLTDNSVYTRDPYNQGIDFGDTKPYQEALTVVKSITTPTDSVFYKYAGARMHNGEYGYLGFKSITSVLAKENQSGGAESLVTTSYLSQRFPFVGKLESVKKKVYSGEAATVIDQISYGMGEENHLIAMHNGIPVGATTTSDLATNFVAKGASATGTNFTGQMNSYFDWYSRTLTGGIHKIYLREKIVDHLQLSDDALVKTERTYTDFYLSPAANYARKGNTSITVYDANGGILQRERTTLTYENSDSYGLPGSFLVDTETTTTLRSTRFADGVDYFDASNSISHHVEIEFDYYSNGLVQYQWLNRNYENGTRTTFEYDSYGNTTRTTLEAVTVDANQSESARTTSRTYTSQGKYLATETNSLGHTTSYQNYTVHGLPGRSIDPKGLSTQFTYDGVGRINTTIDYLNNTHRTLRGFCTGSSNGCSNNAYYWEKQEVAAGADTYTWWDQRGRVVKVATQSLQSGDWVVQAWEYDQYGREVKASVPTIQGLNAAVSFTATTDSTYTEYSYDELNRVVRTQLPGVNRVVSKNYNNELAVVTTDPLGRVTRTYTNALGQIVRQEQADGTNVLFEYDALGNVTLQRFPRLDSAGNVLAGQYLQIVNSYDRYGNHTGENDPSRGNWTYEYNAFGELIQQTDARGEAIYFGYDSLGRMLSQRDNESYSVWQWDTEESGLIDSVSHYDISSLSGGTKVALTPANVASTSGVSLDWEQSTDYNNASKLPEWVQTRQRDANNQLLTSTATNTYDSFGRVQHTQLPALYQSQGSLSAPRLSYSYSSSGYLNRIQDRDSSTLYQQVNSMDAFGNITEQTLAGNVEVYRGYSATTGWASDLQATNNSGLIIDQSYSNYNALGHIGQRDDAVYYSNGSYQSWSDSFNYNDSLQQQLTGVTTNYGQNINGVNLNQSWNHSYNYDPLGNIRSKSITVNGQLPHTGTLNYQYSDTARPHRLTATTGSLSRNYNYDANGNVINDGSKTFTYNAHNKVRQLTQSSNSTRFEYGSDRSRYLRVDVQGATTTETLYVGNGYERVKQSGDSNRIDHKYHIHGIALVIKTEGAGSSFTGSETTQGMISDYQDSLLALTDGSSGAIQQRFRYTPFGEQVEVSTGVTGSNHFTTQGYTSHEHIEGMDIIHMNGRIYDPLIGRMVQADIVVQSPKNIISYNRYAYVFNNPLNRTDPTGYISPDGDGPESNTPNDARQSNDRSSNDKNLKRDDKNLEKDKTEIQKESDDAERGFLSEKVFGDDVSRVAEHIVRVATRHVEESIAAYDKGEISRDELSFQISRARSLYSVNIQLTKTKADSLRSAFQTALAASPFAVARFGKVVSNVPKVGLDDLFKAGRTPKASELKKFAEQQGFKPSQTANGPLKFVDENGVTRITIKQGSSRAPGSANPHVELRNSSGQRIDPAGNPVTRKSPGNHTPIDFDL